MKTKNSMLHKVAVLICCLSLPVMAYAQYTRNTYFMDNVSFRNQLNPALTPERGYFNIPIIGGIQGEANSNLITIADFEEEDYLQQDVEFFMKDAFMNKLKEQNTIRFSSNLDLLSFGWYKKNNFWNVNVSVKLDGGANIPKNFYRFLRDARGLNQESWSNYSREFGGERINFNSYLEMGVGHARSINEKLTIGAKAKLLLGIANLDFNIKNIKVSTQLENITPNNNWETMRYEDLEKVRGNAMVEAEAVMKASLGTARVEYDNDGYVKEINGFNGLGFAGVGVGLDLGATYRLNDKMILSAALLDLGFISWAKNSSIKATSVQNRTYSFDGQNYGDAQQFQSIMSEDALLNLDVMQLQEEKHQGHLTSLYSSLVLGGEYKLLNNKLTLGVLSTTRFALPHTYTELTLSSAYQVNRHIGFSLGYSMLQSGGKGLGMGMKLGPVIIASDYLYLGKNIRSLNILFGLSVPMGAKRKS